MGRIRKGSVIERKGEIYGCVPFVDEAGKWRGAF
jgi:hypothetical protein